MKFIFTKPGEAVARAMQGAGLMGALFLALMLGVLGLFGAEDYLE